MTVLNIDLIAWPDLPPEPSGGMSGETGFIELGRILPVVQNFIHPDGTPYTHHEREAYLATHPAPSTTQTE